MSDIRDGDRPKVADLSEKRREKAQEKQKEKGGKLKAALLHQSISDAINNDPLSLLPPLPRRYYTYEIERGLRLVLADKGEDIVEVVSEEAVINDIIAHVRLKIGTNEDVQLTYKQAKDAVATWRALTAPIEEPKSLAWPGESGKCFHRVPWALKPISEIQPTPLFDEMFDRIHNAEALLAWIGSLFDPSSDMQQYVWFRGMGGDGKGALVRFLERVIGPTYRAKQVPERGNKHWSSDLLGARLVVFPDCNHYGFPATGLFKSLTGGDSITIDPKYKTPYTARLKAKFMFLSNARPGLSSEVADRRRIIYCEIDPIGCPVDPLYEQKLWHEGADFLSAAVHYHQTVCARKQPIPVDNSRLDDWISEMEEEFEVFADEMFQPQSLATDPKLGVEPHIFDQLVRSRFTNQFQRKEFREFLERKFSVRKRNIRLDCGKWMRRYHGIKLTEKALEKIRNVFI